jgi:hypothetical protein
LTFAHSGTYDPDAEIPGVNMGKMLVFSSAKDGRDDEYNEWYNTIHLKEVTATEPFKSAQRYLVAPVQGLPEPDHRYVAIYEFDGPAQTAVDSLFGASGSFNMSDALDAEGARIVMIEDL